MLRSAASKVMWVGRATVFLIGVAVILALVFGAASTVSAHTGEKGFFHLGHRNVSKAVSTLVKKGAGPALSLKVGAGQPPLAVNSPTKVAKLNADRIDDREASSFANGVGGKATDADKLDGVDSAGFLKSAQKASDADKLDGIDSTGFLRSGGKAADSDKLDGIDSTGFLRSDGKAADADKLDGYDSDAFFPDGILPPGKTVRGVYAAGWNPTAAEKIEYESVTFGFTLPSDPTPHFIPQGSKPPAQCPGTDANPQAAPGHLCVYEASGINLNSRLVCSPTNSTCPRASRYGVLIRLTSASAAFAASRGTWAVTAPQAQQQTVQQPQVQSTQKSRADGMTLQQP